MIRYFLSCFALCTCLMCLPGCGSGGGEAEFKGGEFDLEAENKRVEDYAAEQAKMEQKMKEEYGSN